MGDMEADDDGAEVRGMPITQAAYFRATFRSMPTANAALGSDLDPRRSPSACAETLLRIDAGRAGRGDAPRAELQQPRGDDARRTEADAHGRAPLFFFFSLEHLGEARPTGEMPEGPRGSIRTVSDLKTFFLSDATLRLDL